MDRHADRIVNASASQPASIPSLMENERGESSGKQDVSARAKFDSFLRKHTTLGKSFSELTSSDVSCDLYGQFLTFLLNDSVGCQTSLNYASSIKRQLEESTGTQLFESNKGAAWYKRARRKLKEEYVQQSLSTGKPLKTQAPLMTIDDLSHISRFLFGRDDARSLADRTLLNNQWYVIGRSSDIGTITLDDLHWQDTFILIHITRLKVRKQHALSIFCTPGDWSIDAFHSLACQLVASPYESTRRLFPQVGDGDSETKIAAYINRLFKDIYNTQLGDKITKNLQSHSSRRGGGRPTPVPTAASTWPIWRIAVMSGWSTPTRSAIPPTLRVFDRVAPDERARVMSFADQLHGLHFSRLEKRGFSDCLTASLVMYFDETRLILDDHIVHRALREVAASIVGPSDVDSHLLAWGRHIRKQFAYDNVQSLPIGQIRSHLGDTAAPDLFVNAHTLADSVEWLVVAYQHVARTQEEIQCSLRDVLCRLDSIAPSKDQSTPLHPSAASPNLVSISTEGPRPPALTWPADLESLCGKAISEVMVQVITCGLDLIRTAQQSRTQKEVARAMQIVHVFAVMGTIPKRPPVVDVVASREWSNCLRRMAAATEQSILAFLEEKKKHTTAKRKRKYTGNVLGILKAWGKLTPVERATRDLDSI